MAAPRLIIVGAGPAGVRCAEALVAAGHRPVLLDENECAGGQIYRQQPVNFLRSATALYGYEATRAQALHRRFAELLPQLDYRPRTQVWNIATREVHFHNGASTAMLEFDALFLCTGATDRLLPVKGWNQAGVYALGGAQVALKSQACAIGRRVAFLGTGPLLYLVAAQYLKAGAQVAAVLDTAPRWRRWRAAPLLLSQPGLLREGAALMRALRTAGVACLAGVEPLEILGEPQNGVQRLRFRQAGGTVQVVDCDAVAMGFHLRPESQLAELAGCQFDFDTEFAQWLPQCDTEGRSSQAGVYLAGDGVRILGARAAELSGRLAALSALCDLGLAGSAGAAESTAERAALRQQLRKAQRFACGLRMAFPWPAELARRLEDDACLCRCENITVGELRRTLRELNASEVNRAKAFSRVGMGRCQGRYCAHAAYEVIADATGQPLESVGRLRAQAPAKPLGIGIGSQGA